MSRLVVLLWPLENTMKREFQRYRRINAILLLRHYLPRLSRRCAPSIFRTRRVGYALMRVHFMRTPLHAVPPHTNWVVRTQHSGTSQGTAIYSVMHALFPSDLFPQIQRSLFPYL